MMRLCVIVAIIFGITATVPEFGSWANRHYAPQEPTLDVGKLVSSIIALENIADDGIARKEVDGLIGLESVEWEDISDASKLPVGWDQDGLSALRTEFKTENGQAAYLFILVGAENKIHELHLFPGTRNLEINFTFGYLR